MDVPNEVLRPGLEAAFIVALVGSRQRPPVPAPAPLRPFLRFQKLPNAALVPLRKVVEEDEDFRARVAAVATEQTVNAASLLWLHRPPGWEDDLARLVEAEGDADATPAGAKALAGRLEAADAKARRLSAELTALRGEVTRAQVGRERAEADAAKARARVDELERAGARAKARSEQAAADAADARRAADEAAAEVAELRRAFDQRDDLARSVVDQPAPVAAEQESSAASAPALSVAPSPPGAGVLPEEAVEAVGGAAAAAVALAASLQALARALTGSPSAGLPSAGSTDHPASAGSGTVPAAAGPARAADVVAARSQRRRPLRIPRGMHVGTAEADAWLLTEARAAVVVDGYNVAKLGWPDAVLSDQRERLLDVLDDLVHRHSTMVEVVFDGADVGPIRPARRRRVGVRFSPPSVLADDVIRELVAGHPSTDPIVVVTNDRAVAHDVRAAGANVVTSDGLLAVARR